MLTRSSVATAAISTRHPQADQAFKEGVESVFRQWTALELAVAHQWGGRSSSDKAKLLVDDILALFSGPDRVYKDDISLILEDYLETNFNTILEDGSPDEIGELLTTMWRKCGSGDFSVVQTTLSREFVRSEMLQRCQGVSADGDAIDSDDEAGEGGEFGDEGVTAGDGAVAMEGTDAETLPPPPEPRVDPDGWETVARGKSKGVRRKP